LIAWLGRRSEGGRRLIWDAEPPTVKVDSASAGAALARLSPFFFLPFSAGKKKIEDEAAGHEATHAITGLALTAAAVP